MVDHAYGLARLCNKGGMRLQIVNGTLWVAHAGPPHTGYYPASDAPGTAAVAAQWVAGWQVDSARADCPTEQEAAAGRHDLQARSAQQWSGRVPLQGLLALPGCAAHPAARRP